MMDCPLNFFDVVMHLIILVGMIGYPVDMVILPNVPFAKKILVVVILPLPTHKYYLPTPTLLHRNHSMKIRVILLTIGCNDDDGMVVVVVVVKRKRIFVFMDVNETSVL